MSRMKMPDGSWRAAGPVHLKLPNEVWRTFHFDGISGTPLKQKMPDGTWRPVAWTSTSALWWIGDDLTGTDGAEVSTWPAHGGGGPTLWQSADGPGYFVDDAVGSHTGVDFLRRDSRHDGLLSTFDMTRIASPTGITVFAVVTVSQDPVGVYASGVDRVVNIYDQAADFSFQQFFLEGREYYGDGIYYPTVTFRNDVSVQQQYWYSGLPAVGTPAVWELRLPAGTGTPLLRIGGVDSTLLGRVDLTFLSSSFTRISLTGFNDVSVGNGFAFAGFVLSELLVVPDLLTGAGLSTKRNYFSSKYGLPA